MLRFRHPSGTFVLDKVILGMMTMWRNVTWNGIKTCTSSVFSFWFMRKSLVCGFCDQVICVLLSSMVREEERSFKHTRHTPTKSRMWGMLGNKVVALAHREQPDEWKPEGETVRPRHFAAFFGFCFGGTSKFPREQFPMIIKAASDADLCLFSRKCCTCLLMLPNYMK